MTADISRPMHSRSVLYQSRPDAYVLDFPDSDFMEVTVFGRTFWIERKDMRSHEWIINAVVEGPAAPAAEGQGGAGGPLGPGI